MMQFACPSLVIREGRERSLLRRHPWIYSGAVREVTDRPGTGDTVRVVSERGEFLAWAAYSPLSKIVARAWSFREDDFPSEDFFRKRFAQAFEYRKRVFGELPAAYRLVHSEADSLPGFTADIYNEFAVCQFSGAGAEKYRDLFAELLHPYAPGGVYERSDLETRKLEGLEPRCGLISGAEPPDPLHFSENGVEYLCSVKTGHKTGFYLDQRSNRRAVRDAAAGMESVLNCFCYTGGFGLAALRGGAAHVLNVDTSGPALEIARANAELNGFPAGSFETLEADVFRFLRTCRDSRKTFDMIILDPPKFADSMQSRERAARGYKDINLLAMKLLRPGGMLFTFSCSGAMDDDLFHKVVDSAASDAGIDFRISGFLSQAPDHPVSSACPEGRYLKGLAGVRTE